MANPNIPITELDFDGIKDQLKTYLRTQTQFKDYNFEGSNLSVLLDVLAYNTFMNNFYSNMVMNEMFLDSAVLKNSVVSHAKELNYLPRSRKSARAMVRVTIIDETLTSQTVAIPEYTNFATNYQGVNYNFVTDQTYVARKVGNGTYIADNVELYEGQMLTSFQREGFIVDSDGVLRVALTNDEVDTDSLFVYVDAEATEDQNIFTRANDVFGIGPKDKVFYVEPYLDNRYSIYFGNNIFGLQPKEFEDVRVRYRICSGADPNGASRFSTSFLEDARISVQTLVPAYGGEERETIESIRYFAPKSLQIQERAITSRDYEILLKQKFPEITAVAAYGGEELTPPQYGKVAVSVYLRDDAQLISSVLANSYLEYLRERSPLSIEPVFVQTQFIYADIQIDTYYSSKFTEKSPDEIETLIRQTIQTYSNDNLEDFDTTLRLSKLSSMIDKVDFGIQSNSIEIMPIIEYSPSIRIASNPTFKFNAELIKPYPFRQSNGFRDYKPAIRSTTFDIQGVCMYMQDDGVGNIQIVTDDMTNPQVVNPKAGTVNYETGEVKLINFVVESFAGSAIRIMARTKNKDISAPKGRVFILRDRDVRVNLIQETIGILT